MLEFDLVVGQKEISKHSPFLRGCQDREVDAQALCQQMVDMANVAHAHHVLHVRTGDIIACYGLSRGLDFLQKTEAVRAIVLYYR